MPIASLGEARLKFGLLSEVDFDQGAQFMSDAYLEAVETCGTQVSMDGRGHGWTTDLLNGFGGA